MRAAFLAALLLALALTVPGASVAATPRVPIFDVGSNEHLLGESGYLYFDAYNLDYAPSAERMTISIPHEFGAVLTDTPGTNLGQAYMGTVTTAQGTQTSYNGQLVVRDASAYSNDPSGEACDPNVHTAVWEIDVKSDAGVTLAVPVAVDWMGSAYQLTMCFDSVHAQGLEVSEVDFHMTDVFRNPYAAGNYLFDAVVTPFAADETPSPATAYEVQGYEDLPQVLTAHATYDPAKKTFAVSGVSRINGKPRVGVNVNIWVGQTPTNMKDIGVAVTGSSGSYTFKKKLTAAPKWMLGVVDHYYHVICAGTTQPGGCVSWTTDGRATYVTMVTRLHT